MDLIELIKKRRSIREFADRPIPKAILENIIDAGRFAPTARNVQPWRFVAVTEKEILRKISGITENGKFIASAGACVLVFSEDTKYYLEDCSAATQNIMLAAAASGVGSCWVAGDKKVYAKEFNLLLGVPENLKIVSLICLGYPITDKAFCIMEKKKLEEILHWEKF